MSSYIQRIVNITISFLHVVFTIPNVVIHMAYSNTYALRFLKVVFTVRNVVIHMAYSTIAYLCSISSLPYLLPASLCDWSSLPAVSTSAKSVACFHVYHFSPITSKHVMSGDCFRLYRHLLCTVMRILWICLNFWPKN